MQRTPQHLNAIILHRDLSGLLSPCLILLRRALDEAAERLAEDSVIVVDNASRFPWQPDPADPAVECLRLDRHHGFSAAHNLVMRRYPADLFLLLNNDVFLHPQALRRMLEVLEQRPRVGIVGARLRYPDGSVQHAGVSLGEAADGGGWHRHLGRPPSSAPAGLTFPQAVTAACWICRRETVSAVGGFDERYDFGGEDIDFCLRARQRGWRIACCAAAPSLHLEASTPGRIDRDILSRARFVDQWRDQVSHDAPC